MKVIEGELIVGGMFEGVPPKNLWFPLDYNGNPRTGGRVINSHFVKN